MVLICHSLFYKMIYLLNLLFVNDTNTIYNIYIIRFQFVNITFIKLFSIPELWLDGYIVRIFNDIIFSNCLTYELFSFKYFSPKSFLEPCGMYALSIINFRHKFHMQNFKSTKISLFNQIACLIICDRIIWTLYKMLRLFHVKRF